MRWTVPRTMRPSRSMNSEYTASRSASRTRCRITCLAGWARARPQPAGGPRPRRDHLLGGLGRDAPELLGRQLDLDLVVELGLAIEPPRLLQRDLELRIGHRRHHLPAGANPQRDAMP